MHTIICYGDSNTYGYNPATGGRYPQGSWVDALSRLSGWHTVGLGVPGRTIPDGDSEVQRAVAQLVSFLPPAAAGDPSSIWIMLGSNDLLCGYSGEEAGARMEAFLQKLCIRISPRSVCLISPVTMQRGTWVPSGDLIRESEKLHAVYQRTASACGTGCISTEGWSVPLAFDGVHFTQEGHRIFAEKLYRTQRAQPPV